MAAHRNWVLGVIGLLALTAGTTRIIAASPVEDSEQLFQNFDRDQSGSVSQAEIGSYDFLRYDKDADGALSQAEFVGGRNADRRAALAGGATDASWKLLDWNNDGFLSGTELDGRWESFDADGDGRVYKKEFLTAATPGVVPPAPVAPPLPPGFDVKPYLVQQPSLWGKSLTEAKSAHLFKYFQLEPLPGTVVLEAGVRHDFRPRSDLFRDDVLLQVLVDGEERIKGCDLLMNRKWIDHTTLDTFPRDIARCTLGQLMPDADRKVVQSLIWEIEQDAPHRRVPINKIPAALLPNPPSAGYQTYLGKQDQFEQRLGTVQLVLWNGNEEGDDKLLRISIQVKGSDEETR